MLGNNFDAVSAFALAYMTCGSNDNGEKVSFCRAMGCVPEKPKASQQMARQRQAYNNQVAAALKL